MENKKTLERRHPELVKTDFRIYIIFHKYLVDSYYEKDEGFNHTNYHFLKTNERIAADYSKDKGYLILNEWDMGSVYNRELQQKTYMAPSAIYHAYKNQTYKGLKAIGFIEYDMVFTEGFTNRNAQIVRENESFITPFSYKHKLQKLVDQSSIKIRGRNAIRMIFKDYNRYFKTNHSPDDYLDTLVTSQQSFLCDVNTFERIMSFIAYIIECKRCEGWLTGPRPSTLLDRYIAISLLLDEAPTIPNSLLHESHHEW